MNQLSHPSDLVFMCDGSGFHISKNFAYRIMNRHGVRKTDSYGGSRSTGNTNVLFFDGHVATFARNTLPWANNSTVVNDSVDPTKLQQFLQDATDGHYTYPHWRVDQ
jgi:prepilin-type processing-associated H-X9-DG protein